MNSAATSNENGSVGSKEQLTAYWDDNETWNAHRRALGLPASFADWKAFYGRWGFNAPTWNGDRALRDQRSIYFIKFQDLLKVGVATDVRKRLASFRLAAPRGLYLRGTRAVPAILAVQVEKQIHLALKPYAKGREWFAIEAPAARAAAEPIIARAWQCFDAVWDAETRWRSSRDGLL